MNNLQNAYVLRDNIMSLLSKEEVASVCTAEAAERLSDGDEYLDLEQLDQGVRRAQRTPTPMSRVLPKNAVHQDTWGKILTQLAETNIAAEHPVGSQESQSASPMRIADSHPMALPCVTAEHPASPTLCLCEMDPAKSRNSSCLRVVRPSITQPG